MLFLVLLLLPNLCHIRTALRFHREISDLIYNIDSGHMSTIDPCVTRNDDIIEFRFWPVMLTLTTDP